MKMADLPHYVMHEIEFEDGSLETLQFWLSFNRTCTGQWAGGYVRFPATEDEHELAIPQLILSNADSLEEVATRLGAKLSRYRRLHGSTS